MVMVMMMMMMVLVMVSTSFDNNDGDHNDVGTEDSYDDIKSDDGDNSWSRTSDDHGITVLNVDNNKK